MPKFMDPTLLAATDGADVPRWEPGAHLQWQLPSGLRRQYSLCGDPTDRRTYTVCVLRQQDGRGGSIEVHDDLQVGTAIDSSPPRNNFPLKNAPDFVLLAGGIGITPIKPMLEELHRRGVTWRLIYGGRNRRSMAFADELVRTYPDRVALLPEDEHGLPDLGEIVGSLGPQSRLYCCGPARMLAAVTDACAEAGVADRLHLERFGAAEDAVDASGEQAFEVQLQKSGVVVVIPANQRILDTVRAVRPNIESSCNEGYCGTCETRVLAGQPEHRGSLMSAEEHDEDGTMLICVGRARSATLVLDL
jgi:ferredoxin-NADP reductase